MKKRYQNSEEWQSIFVVQVSKLAESPQKTKILIDRVISLEKKVKRLQMDLGQTAKVNPDLAPMDKNFYSSMRWKKLRYEFLRDSQRICVLCGSEKELHVDHIVPRSIDPSLALVRENLQVLCKECNFGKSNKDWKPILRRPKITVER